MFKRMIVAVTFVAALGAATLATSSKAEAHGGWGNRGYSYGPTYRTAYYPTYYPYPYAPRVAVYPPVYPQAYPVYYGRGGGGPHRYHNHGRDGITVSFGF